MVIRIDQVRLESLNAEHADALFQLIDTHRAYLREWLAWVDGHTSRQHTLEFIQRCSDRQEANDGTSLGLWVDESLAGVAGLHYIDWADRMTSVGFWLAPPFSGLGLMTRAVFGLMTLAFDEYDLYRFEGRAATGNVSSRALFERLGFREEGTLRCAQKLRKGFVDHVVYSVVGPEWPAFRDRWPVSLDLAE